MEDKYNMKAKLYEEFIIEKLKGKVYHASSSPINNLGGDPMFFAIDKSHSDDGWFYNLTNSLGYDSAYQYEAKVQGKIADIEEPEIERLFIKNEISLNDWAADLTSNPTAKEILNFKGTKLLQENGYVGATYFDYDPRDFQSELQKALIVFNPQKNVKNWKLVKDINEKFKSKFYDPNDSQWKNTLEKSFKEIINDVWWDGFVDANRDIIHVFSHESNFDKKASAIDYALVNKKYILETKKYVLALWDNMSKESIEYVKNYKGQDLDDITRSPHSENIPSLGDSEISAMKKYCKHWESNRDTTLYKYCQKSLKKLINVLYYNSKDIEWMTKFTEMTKAAIEKELDYIIKIIYRIDKETAKQHVKFAKELGYVKGKHGWVPSEIVPDSKEREIVDKTGIPFNMKSGMNLDDPIHDLPDAPGIKKYEDQISWDVRRNPEEFWKHQD